MPFRQHSTIKFHLQIEVTTLKERIKQLRKALSLSQRQFAEKIGMKRSAIANYEVGRNEPMEVIFDRICTTFGVSERWLRTGEGEMFMAPSDALFKDLSRHYDLDPVDCSLIEEYMKMNPDDRMVLKTYLRRVNISAALH